MNVLLSHAPLWFACVPASLRPDYRHGVGESSSDASQLSQRRASSRATANGPGKATDALLGIPFWLCLIGFPLAAALATKAAQGNAFEIFLSAAGTLFLFNLVDWLILDWLIVCTITPRFMVLPGTEGMAGYKNYGFISLKLIRRIN